MDFCRNVSVSGDYQQEQVLSPPCSKLGAFATGSIDDIFSAQNTEVDVSLEWLSIFVEDCLSSTGNCLPAAPTSLENRSASSPKPTNASQLQKPQQSSPCLQKFVVPGKARSKRKRATTTTTSAKTKSNPLTSWSHHLNPHSYLTSTDPPLLQQAYWLADSELILPKTEEKLKPKPKPNSSNGSSRSKKSSEARESEEEEGEEDEKKITTAVGEKEGMVVQPRRCSHCLAQRTPQWRAGPLGPKTLCNACGVRYKSGRLLPEYRPAKSPTFVSYLHSNSHKKVMEMRMSLLPTKQ